MAKKKARPEWAAAADDMRLAGRVKTAFGESKGIRLDCHSTFMVRGGYYVIINKQENQKWFLEPAVMFKLRDVLNYLYPPERDK